MYVLGVQDALELKAILPHEECVANLKLQTDGMDVLFVSHRWMSTTAPDEDMRQFSCLQGALRGLTEALLRPMVCCASTEASGELSSTLTAEAARNLIHAYLWYDYLCAPQSKSKKQAGIDSIASYIAASKYLVVLAPVLRARSMSNGSDMESWQARGWCRFERLVYSLTRQKAEESRVFIIHHANFVQESAQPQGQQLLPQKGTFTNAEDREQTAAIVASVARSRLLRTQWSLLDFRFLLASMRYLNNEHPIEKDLSGWLADFAFTPALLGEDQSEGGGWQPLHYAALQGNLDVIRLFVLAGVEVDLETTQPVLAVRAVRGLTPLMTCLLYIPDEMVSYETTRLLFALNADIHKANAAGQAAIHCACLGLATSMSLSFLVEMGANVNARDALGETPLHRLCTMSATTASRSQSVKVLLAARADIESRGGPLDLPPFYYAAAGPREVVELFLEWRADPNFEIEDSKHRQNFARKVQQHAQESILASLALHATGITPLMISAWFGNWPALEAMLAVESSHELNGTCTRSRPEWLEECRARGGLSLEQLKGKGVYLCTS